jgi:hypothetical protein
MKWVCILLSLSLLRGIVPPSRKEIPAPREFNYSASYEALQGDPVHLRKTIDGAEMREEKCSI